MSYSGFLYYSASVCSVFDNAVIVRRNFYSKGSALSDFAVLDFFASDVCARHEPHYLQVQVSDPASGYVERVLFSCYCDTYEGEHLERAISKFFAEREGRARVL